MNNILYKTAKALLYHSPSISKSTLCKIFGGKWIVISGASHGIGKALALKLIEAGADLFLIARTESELQFLHDKARQNGCNVRISVTDLRNRNELDRLCSVLKELPRVDFFFCNAGKSINRRIEDALDRMHDYDRTIDLNYKSLVALSLTLLARRAKDMLKPSSPVTVTAFVPAFLAASLKPSKLFACSSVTSALL